MGNPVTPQNCESRWFWAKANIGSWWALSVAGNNTLHNPVRSLQRQPIFSCRKCTPNWISVTFVSCWGVGGVYCFLSWTVQGNNYCHYVWVILKSALM